MDPPEPLSYQKTKHIQTLFDKLAAVNKKKDAIDKETFLSFCGFPGELGQQLFKIFYTNKTNEINKAEFTDGMKRLRFTEPSDKMGMLFKLFDVNGQGITRD